MTRKSRDKTLVDGEFGSNQNFVIYNPHTKLYYRSTQMCTEVHRFDQRFHAACFKNKDWAILQAIKIRGRRWNKFLQIIAVTVRAENHGISTTNKKRTRWSQRVVSEKQVA